MKWPRRQPSRPGARGPGPVGLDALGALRRIDVRPDFRRAVVFGLIALAALITGDGLGGIYASDLRPRLGAWGCAVAVAVFGVLAARAAATEVDRIVSARTSVSAGSTLRICVLLVGYLIALLSVLDLLSLDVNYLAGGTVVAIVIGVAAQQVLGNLFAGLVLLVARPYVAGQRIRIRSGALGGPHEGVVTSVGLLYTTIQAEDGDINFPNSGLLASAVGPIPDPDPDETDDATGHLTGDGDARTTSAIEVPTATPGSPAAPRSPGQPG